MAVIVVRCPKTREKVGEVEIREVEFGAVPSAGGPLKCPVCGEEHSWLPYAARVAKALSAHKTSSIDPASEGSRILSKPE